MYFGFTGRLVSTKKNNSRAPGSAAEKPEKKPRQMVLNEEIKNYLSHGSAEGKPKKTYYTYPMKVENTKYF